MSTETTTTETTVSATTMPRVVVIILAWNRVEELVACLESFAVVDYTNYEILVVDNASVDASVATVRAQFPNVALIENPENYGFCKGNNIGIRWALDRGADYVFLLNQDTKMTPPLLSELVRVMQGDSRIAITGAKNLMLEHPEYVWGRYGKLTWGPMLCQVTGLLELDAPAQPPRDVDWVIGNACMLSRAGLERIGLLDEEFFQLNEDVDWCTRAHEKGLRVVYVDSAVIHHKGSSSNDWTNPVVFGYAYYLGRNAIVFARKHAGPAQWVKLVTLMTFGFVARAVFHGTVAAVGAVYGQRPFVRGALDGFSGKLRRNEITIEVYGWPFWRLPAMTPFIRFVRWLGA